jgi:hypothetical protein
MSASEQPPPPGEDLLAVKAQLAEVTRDREYLADGWHARCESLEAEVKRLQSIFDDAREMTGKGPDVMISRTLLKTMAVKVAQVDSLNDRLETLLKRTRKTLRITHCADPVGNSWSADLGDWPFCSSGTIPHAIESLVNRHGQLEKEELQKRINEIDQSASL